jgi:NADPH2:quinone reductase
MRSIVVPRLGGPEVLTVREMPMPTPAEGEILVKVKYAGITFGDVYQREGTYRGGKPLTEAEGALPIGGEGVGTIVGIGAGVSGFSEGDVVAWAETMGSYADYVRVAAWRAMKVPAGLSPRDACAV